MNENVARKVQGFKSFWGNGGEVLVIALNLVVISYALNLVIILTV